MEKLYSVKEVANLLGLSEHTIRYYTDKELIPAVTRDKNNNRVFNDEAINWLIGIKYLKECGMPLSQIKQYVELCLVGEDTIKERYDIIVKHQEAALKQLEEAKTRVEYMNNKVAHYKSLLELNTDKMNPKEYSMTNTNCNVFSSR